MTTTTNLIERLGKAANDYDNIYCEGVLKEAALALEAQAKQIAELEKTGNEWYEAHNAKRIQVDQQAKQLEALQADADRYRWLRDNPLWSVAYRLKHVDGKEYRQWRMKDAEGPWGQWHNTHEQAVDAFIAARKGNL